MHSSTLTYSILMSTISSQFSSSSNCETSSSIVRRSEKQKLMDTGSRSRADGSSTKRNGIKASVMKFMKARSLWPAVKKTPRLQYDHENRDMMMMSTKVLTLEDLIMSSPDLSAMRPCSSNRIHPSFGEGQVRLEELLCKFTESLSLEVEMKDEEAQVGQLETPPPFRAETMKEARLKKRVSFRSPVIADIFVLNSPAIYTV